MNGLRKSARVNNSSTVNVKLNENNEIEYLMVKSDGDDDDDDEDEDETDDDDAEEELIENPDGSLSIKMCEKKPKPKPKTLPLHHICAKCSKVFSTPASLKRHLNLCKNLPKEDVTVEKEEFDLSMLDLNDPIYESVCFCCNEEKPTAHYGHVSCNFCPKSFKSHISLERHLVLLHSAQKQFTCATCNATCPTRDILEAHQITHDTGAKRFSCQFCGKDFTRKYHLDRHLQFTSCDKSRKKTETACHVCGKLFSRMDNLREHLRAHIGQSTRKRDYQCPHCEKSFYGSSLLNIHIRTHTGEKPFLCDLCDKSFPSNGALRKHRRSHTGEKPYTCKTCSKSFSAKETLNRHNKTHTGERPYACEYCDKSFIQATQLRSHLFYHTGENGVSCDHCDQKFSRKKRLEQHLREVHFKADNAKAVSNPAKGPKEFECMVCKEKFTRKSALLSHQKTHDDESYKCDLCYKVYKSPAAFKRHIEANHAPKTETDSMAMDVDGETITIIKEDETEPNTYKIVCAQDESPEEILPDHTAGTVSYEIYNYQDEEMVAPKQSASSQAPDERHLKQNIERLLKSVVDDDILLKFGYPHAPVEHVLCSVIEQCGQRPVDNAYDDSLTKLRENVKLLFTSVIDDQSIKEMLNNHTIDEVISHVIKLSDK